MELLCWGGCRAICVLYKVRVGAGGDLSARLVQPRTRRFRKVSCEAWRACRQEIHDDRAKAKIRGEDLRVGAVSRFPTLLGWHSR